MGIWWPERWLLTSLRAEVRAGSGCGTRGLPARQVRRHAPVDVEERAARWPAAEGSDDAAAGVVADEAGGPGGRARASKRSAFGLAARGSLQQRGWSPLTRASASQARLALIRPEQVALRPQLLDVRACLPAAGQHQHRLYQDVAPVVSWVPFTADRDPPRQ
jgi:hypothetical protein